MVLQFILYTFFYSLLYLLHVKGPLFYHHLLYDCILHSCEGTQ